MGAATVGVVNPAKIGVPVIAREVVARALSVELAETVLLEALWFRLLLPTFESQASG